MAMKIDGTLILSVGKLNWRSTCSSPHLQTGGRSAILPTCACAHAHVLSCPAAFEEHSNSASRAFPGVAAYFLLVLLGRSPGVAACALLVLHQPTEASSGRPRSTSRVCVTVAYDPGCCY